MEELARKVDTRNVGRNMIDQFSICQCRTGARAKMKGSIVNGRNEPTTEKYTGSSSAIHEMARAEEGKGLEDKESERQSNPSSN